MEDKKTVRRSYFVHQYEEEEKFLSKMHSEGWEFKKLHMGLPTTYDFERCTPEDYIYQLDYVSYENDKEDYHKLFSDSGWEEIMDWPAVGGKWYYFRRKSDGTQERIYTDTESKLQMADNLLKRYTLFFGMCLLMEINGLLSGIRILQTEKIASFLGIAAVIIMVVAVIVSCIAVWQIVSLNMYKKKIKAQGKINL